MAENPEQVLTEYEQLKDELNQHNHRYYVQDDPTVPDSEYDRLMRRLQEIEQQFPQLVSDDSPSQRVGGRSPAILYPGHSCRGHVIPRKCL